MHPTPSAIALFTGATLVVGTIFAAPVQAAPSKIQISKVKFDSTGNDLPVTNAKLNDEYVVIKNTDTVDRVLTGWTLVDESNHWYTFPTTTLKSGRTLAVHTGSGDDNSQHKYQDRRYYIWNNTHDTAYLRNANGGLADSCGWKTSDPGNVKIC
jgi:Lamin Tail Domain